MKTEYNMADIGICDKCKPIFEGFLKYFTENLRIKLNKIFEDQRKQIDKILIILRGKK